MLKILLPEPCFPKLARSVALSGRLCRQIRAGATGVARAARGGATGGAGGGSLRCWRVASAGDWRRAVAAVDQPGVRRGPAPEPGHGRAAGADPGDDLRRRRLGPGRGRPAGHGRRPGRGSEAAGRLLRPALRQRPQGHRPVRAPRGHGDEGDVRPAEGRGRGRDLHPALRTGEVLRTEPQPQEALRGGRPRLPRRHQHQRPQLRLARLHGPHHRPRHRGGPRRRTSPAPSGATGAP